MAFLSIGVDGDSLDLLAGQPRPRVLAHEGDTLLTCQAALARTDGLFEVRQVFPSRTVLGRSVLVRMLRAGFVELVGPEDNRQLGAIIWHLLEQEEIGTILVDGAVNRLTQVSSIPDAGYVYVTKAERRGLEKAVSEVTRVLALDKIPLWRDTLNEVCHRVPGALTENRLASLPEECECILVQDFSKVFLSSRQLARLQGRYRLFFQEVLPLRFCVVNLFDLERDEFLARLADAQTRSRILFNPYADAS